MVENKDISKLNLYSQDGQFDTSVEAITICTFLNLISIDVHRIKDIKVLKAKPEASHFTVDDYHCILERESSLREHSTLVGGAIPVMRFLYSSEFVDYEWYP